MGGGLIFFASIHMNDHLKKLDDLVVRTLKVNFYHYE